jgi:hypothetical protein
MQGFLVILNLAQIFNLIRVSLKNRLVNFFREVMACDTEKDFRLFGRTPRDIREWTKPPVFEYSFY